jgi:hypothetical protein
MPLTALPPRKYEAFAMRLPEKESDAMRKKRSLKDVAAAPLVKKTAVIIPKAGALEKRAARVPALRKTSQPKPSASQERSADRLEEAVPIDASKRSIYGSLARIAASILIGFVGGYFFGRFFKII